MGSWGVPSPVPIQVPCCCRLAHLWDFIPEGVQALGEGGAEPVDNPSPPPRGLWGGGGGGG